MKEHDLFLDSAEQAIRLGAHYKIVEEGLRETGEIVRVVSFAFCNCVIVERAKRRQRRALFAHWLQRARGPVR